MMVRSTLQDTFTAIYNLTAAYDHYSTLQNLRSTLCNKLGPYYNQNKPTIIDPFPTTQNLPSDCIQALSTHIHSLADPYIPQWSIYKSWLNRYVPYDINVTIQEYFIHLFYIQFSPYVHCILNWLHFPEFNIDISCGDLISC
jgi:hypothetical protein